MRGDVVVPVALLGAIGPVCFRRPRRLYVLGVEGRGRGEQRGQREGGATNGETPDLGKGHGSTSNVRQGGNLIVGTLHIGSQRKSEVISQKSEVRSKATRLAKKKGPQAVSVAMAR